MVERNTRPLSGRLVDLGDRVLRGLRLRQDDLQPELLKAEAAALTGLSDFGDPDFEAGLALYCRTVQQEARLDYLGRQVVRKVLKRQLANRLLLVHHLAQDPDPVELVPPLIVLGLPRTGTTFLHRLLARDPAAYAPPAWLLWRPLPLLQGEDKRRQVAERALQGMHELTPHLESKHHQGADEPDECYHLLDPSFRGGGLSMLSHCPSFFRWALEGDARPAYRMYRQYLEILQRGEPGRRLTLKAPLHTPFAEEILAEIPSARFVQTHRDPLKAVTSMASLAYSMFAMTSSRVTPQQCGQVALGVCEALARGNLAQRARHELPIVDIAYRDLVADPVSTVRRIHEAHGLAWTPQVEAEVQRGVDERPQHKHGKHLYALEDFGLTQGEIEQRLAPYLDRYAEFL